MSSRALRKAQREKEEQERLKRLEQEADALEKSYDDVDDEPIPAAKKSAFALLQADEEPEELADASDDEPVIHTPTMPSASKGPSKKKKKRKKARSTLAGETPGAPAEAEDLDEIDAALKTLSTRDKPSQPATTASGVDPTVEEMSRLLAIDTNHLHAQNEMKRLFGRAALHTDEDEQPPAEAVGGNRRQQRRVQQVGLAQALRGNQHGGRTGLAAMALRRNIFVQGKEDWPQATSGGLGMEVEEKRADGTVLYRFVHNTAYQDVQSQFEGCVASMDPNGLVALCQLHPYHISTLLQVSEIAKQEGSRTVSGDLLERALFSFGRAVHSTFAKNLADGKARLDFRRGENREFWLAVWRYMQNLMMRATWRTVYEWAKLLLSLSPEDDPYAIWLVLDQYALRSRQDLDFLNISRNSRLQQVHGGMPNVQLSQGLAECRAGDSGKGKQALFTAIGRFPWVVARLMQELNVDPPPSIWGKEPRSSKEKLYAELYATRAKDVWNTPETSSLLIEVASALPPELPAAALNADDISRNEARHVLLSDTPALIALVPRKYSSQLDSASDPLPPDNASLSYTLHRGAHPRHTQTEAEPEEFGDGFGELLDLHRFFSDLFPWFPNPLQSVTADDIVGDADGAADHTAGPHETPERIIQQVEASGLSQEELAQRASRLTELRERFLGIDTQGLAQAIRRMTGHEATPQSAESERAFQPHVDDASDGE